MISRRVFFTFTGAAIIVPLRGLASDLVQPHDWLHCIRDLEAAARIGARLRPAFTNEVANLCTESSQRLNGSAKDASPERLNRIIADEFRNGQTVILEGVIFSRAEVVLYDQAYRVMFGV